MEMAGRGFSGSYRFGYQGSEKDNEVSGEGNSYTTEFRQLDPRLGRWFSVDPVFKPWQTPYCSMNNNPISLNDPRGNTPPDEITLDGQTYTREVVSDEAGRNEAAAATYNDKVATPGGGTGLVHKNNDAGGTMLAFNKNEDGSYTFFKLTPAKQSKAAKSVPILVIDVSQTTVDIVSREDWGAKEPVKEGREYEEIKEPLNVYYTTIAVHHSGNEKSNPTVQDIQNQHIDEKEKADIGYHFAIDKDGKIYEGRPIKIKGAHVNLANTGKIGIVLLADLDTKTSYDYTGNDVMTPEMFQALVNLVAYLNVQYGIDYLGGHRDVNGDRLCPGEEGMNSVEYLQILYNFKEPEGDGKTGSNGTD